MPSDSSKIPEGWVSVPLKQLVSPSKEKVEPVEEPDVPYIGLEHIESNTTRIIGHGFARDTMSTKTRFFAGSILYGKLRPYLNKVTIPDFSGVCSTDILVFPPVNDIEMRYLMRFLSTRAVVEFATHQSSGMELPRTSFEKIGQLNIPLPPLAEQRRIVARLEALLADTEQVRSRLDAVAATMQRFRQAVLAAAFDGQLTEGWREGKTEIESTTEIQSIIKEREKYKCRISPAYDDKKLFQLPETWKWIKLGDVALVLDVDHKMPKKVEDGIFFISPKDFFEPNGIDFVNSKKIAEEDYIRLSRKLLPEEGDLIYSRIGTIGKVRKVPSNIKFQISYSLSLIKPLGPLRNSNYLFWLLQSSFVLDQAITNKRSIGVPDLGLKEIHNFSIPFAPLAEQQEIVRRVEALFAQADRIEGEVTRARERVEALTQAVLAKAFRGELVPTEAELARREGREYEPAGALLERVRIERQEGRPRSGKRSTLQTKIGVE